MKNIRSNLQNILHRAYGGALWKQIIVWFATMVFLFILLLIAIDVNFLWLFGRSPGFNDIRNPQTNEASILYSADSVQIGTYYYENRTPVLYEDISPLLIRTLVSTEDVRFYKHRGIDFLGVGAALKDMIRGDARGASTITQQLAKNLFRVRTNAEYSTGLLGIIPIVKLLIIKAKEWIVATKLEMTFSKEDILTMYFNTVDFGNNAFGIKTACDTYFGTTPDRLTYEQAATLIGLLKATSTYNPKRNPENSKARRNIVLGLVFENDQLILNGHSATTMQLDSLQNLPMITSDRASLHNNLGQAPYFRKAVEEYINQLCEQGYINGYDGERKLDLYNAGLKIYTTLDMTMQQYAETAAWKQMRSLQQKFDDHWGNQEPWCDAQGKEIPGFIDNIAKRTTMYSYLEKKYKGQQDSIYYYLNQPHPVEVFTYNGPEKRNMSVMDSIRYMVHFLHCGFIAIEPDTREVKAWVGDIDYNSWEYNKVTARRQPGSTFKLFVYTEAMNQGLTPCDRRMDSYVAYPDTMHGKITKWAPHNANGYFTNANMPLKTAFARSVNSVAVKLGVEMGIKNVARTAHAMGIESKLDETKSLSLGASDVTLIELVNAYCTIAADGIYNMPILVKRIEDKYGNVLYQSKLTNKQAIPYRSAFLMQKMLQNTLTGGGTVAALWQYIHPVLETGTTFGGKTGTTNNHSDAWFVGVTPGLVAGAWVGGEYRSIHFRSGALGQGSRTALPIFGNFIQSVLKDNRFKKYYREFPDIPKEHVENASWSCEGYYQSQAVEDTITYTDIDEENRGPAPTFVVETYTEVETSDKTDAPAESSPTSAETAE